jgi:ribonuclease-3
MATTEPESILASMQDRLGFRFRNPQLLREALTHSSYVNEKPCEVTTDNERLEFLGDAVFDLLVAEELHQRYPTAREGELTAMRATLVRTDTLAHVSRRLDLPGHLFLGRGEEASGGRERPANLCAALEAVIGATYLDRGLQQARRLVLSLLSDTLEALTETRRMRDAKSLLQEEVQGRLHCTPVYRTVSESGPDHAKEFVVEVVVADRALGKGRGPSKQAAEQAAARSALQSAVVSTGYPSGAS